MKLYHYLLTFVLCCLYPTLSDALPNYLELVLKGKTKQVYKQKQMRQLSNPSKENLDSSESSDTLQLISVVFRHGNRVPDAQTGYPNNPYKNVTFGHYNMGDLTKEGQETMYKRGRELRKRYKNLLGDEYFNNLAECTSSSYPRCQMSMQSLLTGLFGGLDDVPMKKIPWQAVPYSIIPAEKDNVLSVQFTCPRMMENVVYPDIDLDDDTQLVVDTLTKYSGFNNVSYRHALIIYDYLKSSSEQGLKVPEEYKDIYPEPLRQVAMVDWGVFTGQTYALIGPLIKLITDSAVSKTSNTLVPSERKMFLYACHDMNIHFILQALNVWDYEEVVYGAYIVFELHNIQGTYGFKVLLQNDYDEPRLLDIPECGTFCPLSYFEDLANNLVKTKLLCN